MIRLTKNEAQQVIDALNKAALMANSLGGTYLFEMQEFATAREIMLKHLRGEK